MTQKEKAPPLRTARPEAKNNVPDARPHKRTAPLRVVQPGIDEEDADSVAVDGFKPLLPEGLWLEAKFVDYATVWMFASPKVLWEFEVVQPGEWFQQRLFRAFRVGSIIGRPAKRGKFKLHAGGDMYETLARLLDYKQRADRISLYPLRHMLFRIRLRTVRIDSRQQKIADHAQYSVIDRIDRAQ